MQNIKAIIFDLGNVILNIDTSLSKTAFEKEGLKDFDQLYTLVSQSAIFDNLETGKLSEEKFYDELRKITGSSLSNQIITKCWNALILDYPSSNIEILKKSGGNYQTFILSNTNEIHYKYYTEKLRETYKIDRLEDLVDKAYFSHQINMRKPNSDIYHYVMTKSNLNYSETLFIDDSEENIIAAKDTGINCIWLKGIVLKDIFNDNGILKSDSINFLY